MYIEQVNSPQDIKQFSAEQLRQLAGEIRNALLTKLSAHGGLNQKYSGKHCILQEPME